LPSTGAVKMSKGRRPYAWLSGWGPARGAGGRLCAESRRRAVRLVCNDISALPPASAQSWRGDYGSGPTRPCPDAPVHLSGMAAIGPRCHTHQRRPFMLASVLTSSGAPVTAWAPAPAIHSRAVVTDRGVPPYGRASPCWAKASFGTRQPSA
jgi:hypothetical protein